VIHIITRCCRPENLPQLQASIPQGCNWVVVFDHEAKAKPAGFGSAQLHSPFTGAWGHQHRNYALDTLTYAPEDWVYFLDDDNIVHPKWHAAIAPFINTDAVFLTWGLATRTDEPSLPPTDHPQLGNIDTASFMVRASALAGLRFQDAYGADGLLAQELASRFPITMIDEYLCYYNYLR